MRAAESWKHQTADQGFGQYDARYAGLTFFDDEPSDPGQVAIYVRDKAGAHFPCRTVDMITPGHAESVIGAWLEKAGAHENRCADPRIRARVDAIMAEGQSQ